MQKHKLHPFLFFAFLLAPFVLSAQLTLRVTAIPANTPPGSSIYAVGTFNNWDPADPTKILTPLGNGQFQIVLNPAPGTVKFKFTRGSWATVEGNASGGFQADHETTYDGQPKTVELPILSWEGGGGAGGTAAPNVQILDDDFYIPQLNRTRRIWLYLPPDYAGSTKNYPVLYMQDGQNLFDVNTSFSGEWEVDESLNELFAQGDYGCIVVGIDNGGADRLDEYSPWYNTEYSEGGDGEAYVEFIVNTLKPFIDSNYRTLPGRTTTGIMGSSMGGIISMYAFSERQDVFSKAGIFSPAFWFGGAEPANHVAANPKEGDARVYFLAGGQEPASVTQNMIAVENAMTTAGFGPNERLHLVEPDGQHTEWFWAREFPDAYIWLFQNAVSTTHGGRPSTDNFKIFPNPAGDWIRLSGVDTGKALRLQILGADGKIWRDTSITAGEAVWTGDLPAGAFVVKVREKKNGAWRTAKLLVQD